MFKRIYLIVSIVALSFMIAPTLVLANTADGNTPAEETVCDGQSGAAYGLCNAYCEAMDCDSDSPNANQSACDKVGTKFENITGEIPPCEVTCPCAGVVLDTGYSWEDTSGFDSCQNSSTFTVLNDTINGDKVLKRANQNGCDFWDDFRSPGNFFSTQTTPDEHRACVRDLLAQAKAADVTCPTP